MTDTIFSKIIDREIPAHIVYEDDLILAFLDVKPVNPGHTLVIPKKHFTNIFDGDPEVLAHMMKIGQRIGKALKEVGLAEGVNLCMNNEEAAGQIVWHAHLHVIPRFKDDEAFSDYKRAQSLEKEFSEVKDKLLASLS